MNKLESERYDTYTFEAKTGTNSVSKKHWIIKIDLLQDEDFSDAWKKIKKLVKLSYPLINPTDIKLIKSE